MFAKLPMFQNVGASAYKEDISNIISICDHLDNPQNKFKSIHIAGTNGKGSTSHMLSSILQESGYKVGLYTSPHLVDFRERIRVNGKMISKESIEDFDIINSSNCEYFIFTPSLQNQIENISIEFSKKDIYVFPDLQNLKCIGKVGEFFLEDNQIKGHVYTNTKLVNLTILLFNLSQIVFHYFMRVHSKRNFYTLVGIGNSFIFLYLYNSINLVSFNLLFVSLLIIYFFDYET